MSTERYTQIRVELDIEPFIELARKLSGEVPDDFKFLSAYCSDTGARFTFRKRIE